LRGRAGQRQPDRAVAPFQFLPTGGNSVRARLRPVHAHLRPLEPGRLARGAISSPDETRDFYWRVVTFDQFALNGWKPSGVQVTSGGEGAPQGHAEAPIRLSEPVTFKVTPARYTDGRSSPLTRAW
jgi:hypothetical protein